MLADVIVVGGDPLAYVTVLFREGAILEVIKEGQRVDMSRPIPERRPRSGEKVSFLAACPLTRAFAFEDTQLAHGEPTLTADELCDLSHA